MPIILENGSRTYPAVRWIITFLRWFGLHSLYIENVRVGTDTSSYVGIFWRCPSKDSKPSGYYDPHFDDER